MNDAQGTAGAVDDVAQRVRGARTRLEEMLERAGQLRARIEGELAAVGGSVRSPSEAGPRSESESKPQVRHESREDGMFLDDAWDIALANPDDV